MWVWKFPEVLRDHRVTVYRLHKVIAHSSVSREALYRWAKRRPTRLELDNVEVILKGLEEITGKRFNLSDFLEYRWTDDRSQIGA